MEEPAVPRYAPVSALRRRAFTLIELLIVVAIIAILAAIAVPNFLEAQTRAKISAAKSDLRTIALGLESYAVDNNQYPYTESLGPTIFMPPGGTPRVNPNGVRATGLTSPIAYLSSIPNDTFKHSVNGVPITAPHYYERAGFQMNDGNFTAAGESIVPADAVGTSNLAGIGADTPVTNDSLTPAQWVLYSLGPDLDNHVRRPDGSFITKSRYHLANRYDATNGTVSPGNILRYPGGTSFP
jgi:type II secretion system protein G